jgi:SAM-dependent methyltransferase
MSEITRLQLGAARLETLDPRVVDQFLDKTWLHLGDAQPAQRPKLGTYALRLLTNPRRMLRIVRGFMAGDARRSTFSKRDPAELYAATNFAPFFFEKGHRLDVPDASIDFIFSEHFLHHLFLDDAAALLAECRRILRPHGVIPHGRARRRSPHVRCAGTGRIPVFENAVYGSLETQNALFSLHAGRSPALGRF